MRISGRSLLWITTSVVALTFGACANYDTRLNNSGVKYLGTGNTVVDPATKESLALKKSYWDGDGITGSPSIIINLGKQTASFYRDGRLVGVSAISSGREGHDTPSGRVSIIQKEIDHHSNLYGDFVDASGTAVVKNVDAKKDIPPPGTHFLGASMPYFMRLTNGGVGMHQGFLPGVPDSHGCIRMPEKMAEIYWANAPLGTPVTIIN
jgi:lipoprotein-anchoring transpeptidase ErfK/SrfK